MFKKRVQSNGRDLDAEAEHVRPVPRARPVVHVRFLASVGDALRHFPSALPARPQPQKSNMMSTVFKGENKLEVFKFELCCNFIFRRESCSLGRIEVYLYSSKWFIKKSEKVEEICGALFF